jgi:hypothetical protein
MTCPPELATTLLDLIQTAALRIRAAGWRGDAAACANEADHIHNLPGLLREFSMDRLQYYWSAEKPSYVARGGDGRAFEPIWDKLNSWMEREAVPAVG